MPVFLNIFLAYITLFKQSAGYVRNIDHPCDKQGDYNRELDLFSVNNFVHISKCTSISIQEARLIAIIQKLAATTKVIIVLQLKKF